MPAIALYTFGLLHEDHDHTRNISFHEMVQAVFAYAEGDEGFVWVNADAWDAFPRFQDPARETTAQTLSLWRDLPAVYQFAYRELHAQALRRRKEWFVKARWPTYVAWWVASNHRPTWLEATERLEHLHDHGATPYAFDFKQPYDAGGQSVRLRGAADS